jgi:putative DNA primase/helicase
MIAENLAIALGGHRAGAGWMARCPAHEDRKPSLSIRDADNKVLVHCHAGCAQERVISALRGRGLWFDHRQRSTTRMARRAPIERGSDQKDRRCSEAALAIWHASGPVEGTPVVAYLRSRGLILPASSDLRFHPGLRHPSGANWPAMVALVTNGVDARPLAIHRTYLSRDGTGKAPIEPQKLMLGPCRGGVVRLAQPAARLMVGEGIETCLSAMQATGHPAWAALSTSGLRSLDLPRGVCNVIVLADGDEAGEAAAQDCARRWKREGRRVRIARPPTGMDFNDLLTARNSSIKESAHDGT